MRIIQPTLKQQIYALKEQIRKFVKELQESRQKAINDRMLTNRTNILRTCPGLTVKMQHGMVAQ